MQSNLAIQTGGIDKKQRDILEFEILMVKFINSNKSDLNFLVIGLRHQSSLCITKSLYLRQIFKYIYYICSCNVNMSRMCGIDSNFYFFLLFQAPDICRAQNIFVLSLDEIIDSNIALAVFIGKY